MDSERVIDLGEPLAMANAYIFQALQILGNGAASAHLLEARKIIERQIAQLLEEMEA